MILNDMSIAIFQDPNDLVDISVVESVVRNSISLATSTFNITQIVTGGSNNFQTPPRPTDMTHPAVAQRMSQPIPQPMAQQPMAQQSMSQRSGVVFEPIQASEQQSAVSEIFLLWTFLIILYLNNLLTKKIICQYISIFVKRQLLDVNYVTM